jgi:hypothetical protein
MLKAKPNDPRTHQVCQEGQDHQLHLSNLVVLDYQVYLGHLEARQGRASLDSPFLVHLYDQTHHASLEVLGYLQTTNTTTHNMI